MKNGLVRRILGVLFLLHYITGISSAQSDLPERIVSLGPALTESLYLLGVSEKIVGVTTHCQKPPAAKNKEKVGTVVEFNVEKVLNLKPDLVLATALTEAQGVRKLKDLGIRIVVFDQAKNFKQLCDQFQQLSNLVGKQDLAKKIVSQARKKVEGVCQRVKNQPKTSVFVQVGTRPLFTVTRDSFVNDYVELAGGVNIARDTKIGLFSREEVLYRNPDVIIIIAMGLVAEREKENWKKYENLRAADADRIYIIDAYKIGSPTPITFGKTLEEIANFLHPR